MRELNSVELKKELERMAATSKKYDMSIFNGIITAIMKVYSDIDNYYSGDAIKTMNGFINKGILNFSKEA